MENTILEGESGLCLTFLDVAKELSTHTFCSVVATIVRLSSILYHTKAGIAHITTSNEALPTATTSQDGS